VLAFPLDNLSIVLPANSLRGRGRRSGHAAERSRPLRSKVISAISAIYLRRISANDFKHLQAYLRISAYLRHVSPQIISA